MEVHTHSLGKREVLTPPRGQLSPTSNTAALLFKLDKVPTYSTPPPASNIPENNICKMIEYRGAKVAAFTVDGRELICLPQAFDLFLKHLVGGLHTVYTKLKRLDITPVVCNVEQVRILRGLGAIQPGVNRCKLIAPKEFDVLYEDCTNSSARPGRPPKRSSSLSSPSPDTLQRLKKAKLDTSDYYGFTERYLSEKKSPLLSNGYNPYPHHLAALPFMPHFAHPYAAMSMAAMSGHLTGIRPEDLATVRERQAEDLFSPRSRDDRLESSSSKSLDRSSESDKEDRLPPPNNTSEKEPVVERPKSAHTYHNDQVSKDLAHHSGNEGSAEEDESDDEIEKQDKIRIPTDLSVNKENTAEDKLASQTATTFGQQILNGDHGKMASSIETLLLNIQGLLKVAAENARHHERQMGYEKAEMKLKLSREKEQREELERQLLEEQKNRIFYQKKWKKEKKTRRRLQEQMDGDVKRNRCDEAARYSSPDSMRHVNGTDSQPTDSDSERSARSPVSRSEPERKLPVTSVSESRGGIHSLMESYLATSLASAANGYLHPPPPLKADLR